MSTKCYLSGPITGVANYMDIFDKYEKELTLSGYSVINPARVNASMPTNTTWGDYMKMSMAMMELCDCIFLMPGWEKSKGASFERNYAEILGLDIIVEETAETYESKLKEAFPDADPTVFLSICPWHLFGGRAPGRGYYCNGSDCNVCRNKFVAEDR